MRSRPLNLRRTGRLVPRRTNEPLCNTPYGSGYVGMEFCSHDAIFEATEDIISGQKMVVGMGSLICPSLMD
jgi:hypothetical protein